MINALLVSTSSYPSSTTGPGRSIRWLRQPLDAAGSEHERRHCPVEEQDRLSEDERRIVKRNLGFFSTADSLVANNLVLATYRLITNPEWPVHPAPGLRRGDPHPRLPVLHRIAGHG
ncbi:hypothetical protein [Stutzerimonas xanthomarina]|uniref:hypothetical protein n=1 Tax=Stutzerimonas xanthomarina TaxID=271420 RepID=UPI003AA8429B